MRSVSLDKTTTIITVDEQQPINSTPVVKSEDLCALPAPLQAYVDDGNRRVAPLNATETAPLERALQKAVQAFEKGDYDGARQEAHTTREEAKRIGAAELEARAAAWEGTALHWLGDVEGARKAFDAALAGGAEGKERALALGGLGCIDRDEGRSEQAAARLLEAATICHGLGDFKAEADWMYIRGLTFEDLGRFQEALIAHQSVADASRKAKHMPALENALLGMGRSFVALEKYSDAKNSFAAASRVKGEYEFAAEAHLGIEQVRNKDVRSAEKHFTKSLRLASTEGWLKPYYRAIAHAGLGHEADAVSALKGALGEATGPEIPRDVLRQLRTLQSAGADTNAVRASIATIEGWLKDRTG